MCSTCVNLRYMMIQCPRLLSQSLVMPGTKRKSPNSSRTTNPRPRKITRNINSNANNRIASRRRLGLTRAVLRARVYQSLLQSYGNRQVADIYAAVNRALARAGI